MVIAFKRPIYVQLHKWVLTYLLHLHCSQVVSDNSIMMMTMIKSNITMVSRFASWHPRFKLITTHKDYANDLGVCLPHCLAAAYIGGRRDLLEEGGSVRGAVWNGATTYSMQIQIQIQKKHNMSIFQHASNRSSMSDIATISIYLQWEMPWNVTRIKLNPNMIPRWMKN